MNSKFRPQPALKIGQMFLTYHVRLFRAFIITYCVIMVLVDGELHYFPVSVVCVLLIVVNLITFWVFRKKKYGEKKRLKWFLAAAVASLVFMVTAIVEYNIHIDDCCSSCIKFDRGPSVCPAVCVRCENPFDNISIVLETASVIGFVNFVVLGLLHNRKWYMYLVILSATIVAGFLLLIIVALAYNVIFEAGLLELLE